eukprot:2439132-Pyramimonas_sp.AAC.1
MWEALETLEISKISMTWHTTFNRTDLTWRCYDHGADLTFVGTDLTWTWRTFRVSRGHEAVAVQDWLPHEISVLTITNDLSRDISLPITSPGLLKKLLREDVL